jgi:hypothetical protein
MYQVVTLGKKSISCGWLRIRVQFKEILSLITCITYSRVKRNSSQEWYIQFFGHLLCSTSQRRKYLTLLCTLGANKPISKEML